MERKRPAAFALLLTKACTGQRFCHVSALQWGDIDFDAMVIRFRRKQVRGVVGPISKKKPVPKEMPMLPALADALTTYKARQVELEYPVGDGDWVFPTRNRKLKQPSSLTNSIASSAKEAKVKSHITLHKMRYMFSDLLRLARVDKVTRKAMVGHVTDEMQEHYSTVGIDEKREAMAAAGAKLDGVRRQVDGAVVGYERGYASKKTKAV
jgi:integrase